MSLPLACVFQCLFVISGNFCFSFVSNSLACITIPKSNYLRLKINYNIYICACFHFVLIGRNLTAQLTGATRELEVEFKFQRRSCEHSFFFLPAARVPQGACLQGKTLNL